MTTIKILHPNVGVTTVMNWSSTIYVKCNICQKPPSEFGTYVLFSPHLLLGIQPMTQDAHAQYWLQIEF